MPDDIDKAWWYCLWCGVSNGPRDTRLCYYCGRSKDIATSQEHVDRFFAEPISDAPAEDA